MHVCVKMCTLVCMYVCTICTHIYIYIHIYTCMHRLDHRSVRSTPSLVREALAVGIGAPSEDKALLQPQSRDPKYDGSRLLRNSCNRNIRYITVQYIT